MDFYEAPRLASEFVVLEPLDHSRCDELAEAVAVGDVWRAWYTNVPSPDQMADEVRARLDLHAAQVKVPWVIVDPATDMAVTATEDMPLATLVEEIARGPWRADTTAPQSATGRICTSRSNSGPCPL